MLRMEVWLLGLSCLERGVHHSAVLDGLTARFPYPSNTFYLADWVLYTGIGVFQEFYQSSYLQNYSAGTISWIPSLQVFFMFATVRDPCTAMRDWHYWCNFRDQLWERFTIDLDHDTLFWWGQSYMSSAWWWHQSQQSTTRFFSLKEFAALLECRWSFSLENTLPLKVLRA